MALTKVTYSMIYGAPLNVKDYGALGDGVTDDSAALNLAATALQNGQSLYFPAGDYIVNTACVLFRGKSNIAIFGDGLSTRVRPTNQGPTGTKQDYHTTLAIDQCDGVTLANMVIESKGENYGDTDSYGYLSAGNPRTNAIINYGGSAVLVARSNEVTLDNITARYCGSVGVVYLTSSQNIVVQNCFANALSLGYAGFAVDNWADASVQTQRTYKFINCSVSAENASYAAKGGIVAEGDEITQRLLNVTVIGGFFEDCASGGDYPEGGCGVIAWETRLVMIGVTTNDCYSGLYFKKRGGAVDYTWCRVDGCVFQNNRVTGILFGIGSATGGADITINATTITTASTSQWASAGFVTNQAVKVSSGIAIETYMNAGLKLNGCTIDGPQYGIFSVDFSPLKVTGSTIVGINGGITQYGGGSLQATGNNISVTAATAADVPIYMNSANYAASANYNTDMYVVGNTISAGADGTSNLAIQLTGNAALFINTIVKNNLVINGQISANSAVTYLDLDQVVLQTTQRVAAVGLSGGNTFVDINLPKEFVPLYAYAVGTDEVSRSIIATQINQGGTRGLVRIFLSGDVRSNYAAASNARVTMMR